MYKKPLQSSPLLLHLCQLNVVDGSQMADRDANNTDWISHLPPEIIEKILILLPCHEAVRTSILSSDWRYRWMSMSDLNFGGEAWGDEDKHAKFITECLSRHQGPIRKFSVTSHTSTVRCKINQWLELVSKHDIEELQVVYGYPSFISPLRLLLNCKKLTHLELSGCLLDLPLTFEGFMNLKVLNLSSIRVKDKSSIESLISKSPLLERISLNVFDCSDITNITICAPKVKFLSLLRCCKLKDICLKKSPVLVDMSLHFYGYQRDCDLIKILNGGPNLEKLAVREFEHFKIGCNREVLSTTFNYLKVMTLYDFYLGESEAIPLVLELLRSAPNLEKLVICNGSVLYLTNKADSEFWQKEYLVGHCFMKLKVVEMGDILCTAPEIEFVKFILSNSPFLEKMTIGTPEWNHAIRTRMLKELPTLPRASAQVAVTIHGGDNPWSPTVGSLESER